ncbi:Transcriptional regulatory protein DegU [Dyadobacter sp. CECT 9623]|uniref:Transcriptional regulatory protein DegU n=1 Tax=Dyadobacter linearis TaxID=2823330 RepID=A0ABM8UW65_9BACT|nr:response regulator transcription factor [Dyadobacter sp. CECT 9623]CAG5072959.1 Transcriptional regulatory protein DegU [Dyadobacter sp. CECT 9623]
MTLTSQTRILLVDDHHIFNEGLKRLINEQPGYSVCGQVYQSKDIFPAIENLRPHLILLDVNLKGVNGIDIGKRIIKDYPAIKVIVLTMYNQSKLLEESRKTGLHGYLLKDATTAKLLNGIETVLQGRSYFDEAILGTPQQEDQFTDTFAQKLNLTFREIEIIRLIKNGYTNEQIADQLHLSFFTIKTHRKNIHFKLGLTKVTELIDFAVKNGI